MSGVDTVVMYLEPLSELRHLLCKVLSLLLKEANHLVLLFNELGMIVLVSGDLRPATTFGHRLERSLVITRLEFAVVRSEAREGHFAVVRNQTADGIRTNEKERGSAADCRL